MQDCFYGKNEKIFTYCMEQLICLNYRDIYESVGLDNFRKFRICCVTVRKCDLTGVQERRSFSTYYRPISTEYF